MILTVDQFLFLMVMVALGLSTRLAVMAEAGAAWRLIGVGAAALAISTITTLLLVLPLASRGEARAATGESAMLADAGGHLFGSVGCAKCQVPALAGEHGEVLLYSDLLLYDMGPALDDKIVQGSATGADWRTTPLVGLGARRRYLHDGRAMTLRDVILAHGGEAEIVRNRFFGLREAERQAIYAFLGGL